MNTPELQNELAQVDGNIKAARAALVTLARKSNSEAESNSLAARIMALEARRVALGSAIEQAEGQTKKRDDVLKSKEYKDAKKRMTEAESYFASEAQAVSAELFAMRDRLRKARQVYNDFMGDVTHFDIELDTLQKNARLHNDGYLYLAGVSNVIEIECKRAETLASLKSPRKDGTAQKVTVKPSLYFTPNG